MNYIIDSSFIISYLNKDDSNHLRAIEIAKAITIKSSNINIYMSNTILAELLTVIKLRLKKLEKPFKKLTKEWNVRIINTPPLSLVLEYSSLKTECSFADISVMYHALQYNAIILTIDKKLLEFAKQRWYIHSSNPINE